MNVIINGFMHEQQEEILNYFEKNQLIKKCCIIWHKEYNKLNNNTDYFIVNNIIKGEYPKYSPLAPEQIHYINENFFQLMEMCNRFYSYLHKDVSYEERKKIIYNHFSFWMNYISENNITCFISSNIPHDIYDQIILLCMKFYKKERILFFYQSNFRDMIIPMNSIDVQNLNTKQLYDKIYNENVELSELCKIEWKNEKDSIIPFYMKKKDLKNKIIGNFRRIKHFSFSRMYFNLLYYRKTKTLSKEYRTLQIEADFSKKYIYFPMHYQPELTSCMLGPDFVNQYLTICLLDSLLPLDWRLFVKEHPAQKINNRYLGYYEELLKHTTKTCLINLNTPSSELIKHCEAVITISGTAGWEALFQEKPVILCGHNFYQYAPGVYQVKTKEDLENAVGSIVNNEFLYSENKLKAFLKAVDETSIHGFIDSVYSANSSFSFKQSNANIIQYIKEWLEQK